MEQVLGIHSRGAGFSTVDIRPDPLDLKWARGAEPTPNGLLKVDIRNEGGPIAVTIGLPPGVAATVSVPLVHSGAAVLVNGQSRASKPSEGGTRATVVLNAAGSYVLSSR